MVLNSHYLLTIIIVGDYSHRLILMSEELFDRQFLLNQLRSDFLIEKIQQQQKKSLFLENFYQQKKNLKQDTSLSVVDTIRSKIQIEFYRRQASIENLTRIPIERSE